MVTMIWVSMALPCDGRHAQAARWSVAKVAKVAGGLPARRSWPPPAGDATPPIMPPLFDPPGELDVAQPTIAVAARAPRQSATVINAYWRIGAPFASLTSARSQPVAQTPHGHEDRRADHHHERERRPEDPLVAQGLRHHVHAEDAGDGRRRRQDAEHERLAEPVDERLVRIRDGHRLDVHRDQSCDARDRALLRRVH